jgi:hypothetical protein
VSRSTAVAIRTAAPRTEPQDRNAAPSVVPFRSPDYHPGLIREATDHEHGAVSAFVAQHPEYAKLSTDAVEQVMATYRTDEEHETFARLHGEGVTPEWRGAGRRWSDDA